MHPLYQVARPGNALMAAVGAAVGAVVAASAWPPAAPLSAAMASTALVTAGGNALNDALDAPLDAAAHPRRPIPSGRLTVRTALRFALAAFVAAVVVALTVPRLVPIVVLAVALLVVYEKVLKRRGLVGNAAIGLLVGLTFVAGAVATGAWPVPAAVLVLGGLAALSTVAREIVKDVEDAPADAGRHTLGQRAPRAARGLALLLVVGAVALSILPVVKDWLSEAYAWIVAPADAAFIVGALVRSPSAASRLLKSAMNVALVAFVAGALA